MKKSLITLITVIALAVCALSVLTVSVGAEATEPELSIKYCNLSFRDSICIKYAVEANVSDVQLLIWTSPESEYVIGTQDDVIADHHNETINGVSYTVFDYTKIVAKKMTDVVYARAYVRVNGVDYYSKAEKYSVLQYAYNKLGKTATASENEELKALLNDMLAYGASAQKYLDDYKTDRLATDDWYQVKLTAGTLDDGFTHGLYRPGDTVTMIAPQTNSEGEIFSHWEDSNENEVANTASYELTVGNANEVYTPVYEKGVTELLSVKALNNNSSDGSHINDSFLTSSLEINYRESVELRSSNTGATRYDNAWYPRIKKVSDDLYVMFFMYSQLGQHLYVTTSTDGYNWASPEVFWNSANHKFTYTYGSLEGTDDRYYAVNADACVLDNGDILCVYSVRPKSGYSTNEYIDLNGLWIRRGTVNDGKISWSAEKKIYTGHLWEPYIMQRTDGRIEIYWSCIVGYVQKYGFDSDKRSTCTAMIYSDDNGNTWIPDIQPGAADYVPIRVYQEYVGDKVPYGTNLAAVPYFGGQMPSAVQLYNGRTLLAVEVQTLDKAFHISLGSSEAGGAWSSLGLTETGPDSMMDNVFSGAAPYLARFPSGEVYITYGSSSRTYGRMISPDGTQVDSAAALAAEGVIGSWASTEVVGSHEVIVAAQSKVDELYGIHLVHAYLNHRINSPEKTVSVDGFTNDWTDNTDALFVGSESQAQITLRTAHDDENVYLLVTRLDKVLTDDDRAVIYIGADSGCYGITLGADGLRSVEYMSNKLSTANVSCVTKVLGTVGDTSDEDEGIVYELSIPKALLGLEAKTSFTVLPALDNCDGGDIVNDTLTNVTLDQATRWPSVVLD